MIRFSTALRDAIASNYGLGMVMNKGVIRVYSAPMPATPDAAPTGSLLGTISTDGIAYIPGVNKDTAGLVVRKVSPGIIEKVGDWRLKGSANGTAFWFRWYSSQVDDFGTNTNFIRIDGLVGAELILSNLSITPTTNASLELFKMQLGMSQ